MINFHMNTFCLFSVFDIITDFLLFISYINAESFLRTVQFQNDSLVMNITGSRTCILVDENKATRPLSNEKKIVDSLKFISGYSVL